MANPSPLISVVLPVRNAVETLERAVRSLQWQSYTRWELLIVDDGSTDGSDELIRHLLTEDARLHGIRFEHPQGIAACLNAAVDAASGDVVARMDADDISLPTRFERQVSYLQAHPIVDVVGSWMYVFRRDGELAGIRSGPTADYAIKGRATGGFRLFHPTWMGRAEWFRRYRYDPAATRCEDQVMLLDAHAVSHYANLGEPLLGYMEDGLRLRKALATRFHFARRASGRFLAARRRREAIEVIAIQIAKGLTDIVARVTRTERWLVRHRAQPAASSDRRRWNGLWEKLQDSLTDPN